MLTTDGDFFHLLTFYLPLLAGNREVMKTRLQTTLPNNKEWATKIAKESNGIHVMAENDFSTK
jgi:hypothetical protein